MDEIDVAIVALARTALRSPPSWRHLASNGGSLGSLCYLAGPDAKGMLLRSEPYASDVASPAPGFTVRDYCLSQELPYVERRQPSAVRRSSFMQTGSHVLSCPMSSRSMSLHSGTRGGFLLATEDRGQIRARRVSWPQGSYPSPMCQRCCDRCRTSWCRTARRV